MQVDTARRQKLRHFRAGRHQPNGTHFVVFRSAKGRSFAERKTTLADREPQRECHWASVPRFIANGLTPKNRGLTPPRSDVSFTIARGIQPVENYWRAASATASPARR